MHTDDPHTKRKLASVKEAEVALNLCRSSVHHLIRTGELESVKLGSRRLIPFEAIDRLIARKLEAGQRAAA